MSKIILKKSSVAAKNPLAADLDYGELALNYTDGKLYFKNASNVIKSFTIDDSVVTLTGIQTLTNKTLTSPVINSGALSGTFSGAITLSDATASTSTTTGALKISGGLGVVGSIYADQIRLTNNGSGTNVYIGDDVVLGDVNAANTLSVRGIQDATKGYIVFGNANNTAYIGRDGTNPITATGQFAVNSGTVTGTDAVAFQISGYANKGGTGYHDFLKVTNSYVSATNISKFFRLNSIGNLEIINSDYTANIFTLTDGGILSVPQISAGGSTGTSGQVLQSTGTGLQWATVSAGGGGSVSSVAMTVPTGLSVSGSPITSSGTLAVTLTSGYSIPTTASQTNWDTAYADRNKWDGGSTGLVAATARTSLGLVIGTNVQAWNADLDALITNTSGYTNGLIRRNSTGQFSVDQRTYAFATDLTSYMPKAGGTFTGKINVAAPTNSANPSVRFNLGTAWDPYTNNDSELSYVFDGDIYLHRRSDSGRASIKFKAGGTEYTVKANNTYTLTTSSTSSNQVIASIVNFDYRAVKFLIRATCGSLSKYHTTEILAIQSGADANYTEYASVNLGGENGTFDVVYDAATQSLQLRTTPTSSNTTIFVAEAQIL